LSRFPAIKNGRNLPSQAEKGRQFVWTHFYASRYRLRMPCCQSCCQRASSQNFRLWQHKSIIQLLIRYKPPAVCNRHFTIDQPSVIQAYEHKRDSKESEGLLFDVRTATHGWIARYSGHHFLPERQSLKQRQSGAPLRVNFKISPPAEGGIWATKSLPALSKIRPRGLRKPEANMLLTCVVASTSKLPPSGTVSFLNWVGLISAKLGPELA